MDAPRARPAPDQAFRRDVLDGLSATHPAIPSRWLYDRRGSELFEEITQLPEYYLTRTERRLLERHCGEMAALAGVGPAVVELGSGSSAKTPILLRAIEPAAYVPIDISSDYLFEASARLQSLFPGLTILPVEGDFMSEIRLPPAIADMPKLGFFPGSTIGNMVPSTAVDLLRDFRHALGTGSHLLIGLDRVKERERLLSAYDDAAGVTAEFNLNMLHRINAELDGTIPADAFRHRAKWNDGLSRIEMHLEAVRDVTFTVGGTRFAFNAGDTIHTENSHKYGPRDGRLLLEAAGWSVCGEWSDAEGDFALLLGKAEPPRAAP